MTPHLLLVVAESYRLTGLGLLAIGRQAEPVLQQFTLHTKLEVRLLFPDGRHQTVVASVEEMSRPLAQVAAGGALTTRTETVLLLESDLVADLPPGTEIWWSGVVETLL